MANSTDKRPSLGRNLGFLGLRSIIPLAILVLVVLAAQRSDIRWDLTADNRFSIQPELATLINDLTVPIQVHGIWANSPDTPGQNQTNAYIQNYCASIDDLSNQISYHTLDAVLDQVALEKLSQQLGATPQPNHLYITREGRRPFSLPITAMGHLTFQRDFGGALITQTEDRITPLYVLGGHGMLELSGDRDGIETALNRLTLAGFDVRPTLTRARLSKLGRIPQDGIVLIPGPIHPLGSETIAYLKNYLDDGGAALFAVDHRIPNDVANLLEQYGLFIGRSLIANRFGVDNPDIPVPIINSLDHSLRGPGLDFHHLLLNQSYGLGPQNEEQTRTTHFISDNNQHSPIVATRSLNLDVISPLSTPLQTLDFASMTPEEMASIIEQGFLPYKEVHQLLQVQWGDAWVSLPEERNTLPDTKQQHGHWLTIAKAIRQVGPQDDPDNGPRIVLWGSRVGLTNVFTSNPLYANDQFIADCVNWLARRDTATRIARQNFARYQIEADDTTEAIISAILIAITPVIFLAAAMLSYWDRR